MGKNAIVKQANTYLKAKTLLTLMVIEFDQDGWSARAYTPREFMREAGISRSGNQQKKFAEYWQGLVTAGVLEVRADGHFKVGKLFPGSGEIVPTTRVKSSQAVGKLFPGSGEIVPKGGNFSASKADVKTPPMIHESYKESKDIEDIHDMGTLLSAVGVGINAHSYAVGWSVNEVKAIIRTAREKHIENTAGYVVSALKARPAQDDPLDELRKAYENAIGLMTPMILESMKAAKQKYPVAWVLDAIQEAKKGNARNWQYVEKILIRWSTQGRVPLPQEEAPQPTEEQRRRLAAALSEMGL